MITVTSLLDSAAEIISKADPGSDWLALYDAIVRTPKLAAENALLQARLYALLDAVRDLAVAGTDFPSEVNDAYDVAAPIFGLPLIDQIEKAEDAGDHTALAALAIMETPLPPPFPDSEQS